jgi:hypothetical protein
MRKPLVSVDFDGTLAHTLPLLCSAAAMRLGRPIEAASIKAFSFLETLGLSEADIAAVLHEAMMGKPEPEPGAVEGWAWLQSWAEPFVLTSRCGPQRSGESST